jgi:hypothetical protein
MFLDGARLSASAIIKSFAGTWEIVYLNLISLMRNHSQFMMDFCLNVQV